MAVRPARPEDAPLLVDLVNRAAREDLTLGIDAFPLTPDQEAVFLAAADPLVHLSLLAWEGDRPAGHLYASRGVHQKSRHVGSLALAVAPEFRRRGVGRALLAACLDWGRTVGVTKMTLSVLATNLPARALFEQTGFRPEGTRKGQFSIDGEEVDEVLMALWLDRPGEEG